MLSPLFYFIQNRILRENRGEKSKKEKTTEIMETIGHIKQAQDLNHEKIQNLTSMVEKLLLLKQR